MSKPQPDVGGVEQEAKALGYGPTSLGLLFVACDGQRKAPGGWPGAGWGVVEEISILQLVCLLLQPGQPPGHFAGVGGCILG